MIFYNLSILLGCIFLDENVIILLNDNIQMNTEPIFHG